MIAPVYRGFPKIYYPDRYDDILAGFYDSKGFANVFLANLLF